MNAQMRSFCVAWMVLFCLPCLAQTPTPLPGTPQALTCLDFNYSGISGVEVITNWLYLDRVCVVFENNTGGAIAIASCQGIFGQPENEFAGQLRIWEVLNEQYLPDLAAAAMQVGETYALSAPSNPGPAAVLVRFDLEGYLGGTVPMAVINPGKKFVIDILNQMDGGGLGPGMKITAEQVGECPPSFWSDGTNIFGDQNGSNLTWSFKEDIGNSTNFCLGITYYSDVDPRTPATGVFGLIALIVLISCAMIVRSR